MYALVVDMAAMVLTQNWCATQLHATTSNIPKSGLLVTVFAFLGHSKNERLQTCMSNLQALLTVHCFDSRASFFVLNNTCAICLINNSQRAMHIKDGLILSI